MMYYSSMSDACMSVNRVCTYFKYGGYTDVRVNVCRADELTSFLSNPNPTLFFLGRPLLVWLVGASNGLNYSILQSFDADTKTLRIRGEAEGEWGFLYRSTLGSLMSGLSEVMEVRVYVNARRSGDLRKRSLSYVA